MKHVYLDNNATTRVAPEVFEAMRPYLQEFYGNPSSAHTFGREMRRAVEQSREEVAQLLGAREESEVVFTSCGTESDNWALRGALEMQPDKRHIVTSRVEHEAVRFFCEKLERQGYEVTWLDVNEEGLLDLEELRAALRVDTCVVSLMLANNETGVLFPVEEAARVVHENSNALFHVDGVQAVGKIPIRVADWQVDLFALSGHKFHAPKGVGALYVRDNVRLPSFLIGGGQEKGRRAGTEAVPYIVALGKASDLARRFEGHETIRRLRDRLEDAILREFPNTRLNGARDRTLRLPNTANISFSYLEGETILAHLDEAGISVSTGSACNAESHVSSAVLRAMNVPYTSAQGSIRFSLGRYNTEEEVDYTLSQLRATIPRLVEMSPYDKELKA
jgi:cysteine desulfurase